MQQTTNYKLNKIELSDSPPDITTINKNWDTIDTELKSHKDSLTKVNTDLNGKAAKSHSHTISDLPKATAAEAKAGTVDTKVMTPALSKASAIQFGMNIKTENPITDIANDTTEKWRELGSGVYYFNTKNCVSDQPSQYAFLINHIMNGGSVVQQWVDVLTAKTYIRSGNTNGWLVSWFEMADKTWVNNNFLPKDGSGVMTGGLQMNHNVIANVRSLEFIPKTTDNYGGFIDFHYAGSTEDFTSRIIEEEKGKLNINAPSGVVFNGVLASSRGASGPTLKNVNGGGEIFLFNPDDTTYKGGFLLRAKDNQGNTVDLLAKADGLLQWKNKDILTTATGLALDGSTTMTGTLKSTVLDCAFEHIHSTTGEGLRFGVGASGTNRGVYDVKSKRWMLLANPDGSVHINTLGADPHYLACNTDGSVLWDGKNLVRSINNGVADANGNVDIIAYNDMNFSGTTLTMKRNNNTSTSYDLGNTFAKKTDAVFSVNGKKADDSGNVNVPSRNVGDEWHSYTGKIPEGGVPYCGQTVTRTTYADLWAYAQAQGLVKTETEWQALATANGGNVPFYSSGDGSTTFRMPKIVGYVKGASSQSESGSYVAEGLPNITGGFSDGGMEHSTTDGGVHEGAMYRTNQSGTSFHHTTGRGNEIEKVNFDASRSNSIYGNSNHVTPETSVVLFGVYAFGEIVNTGELDASTLATGLARVEANYQELKSEAVFPYEAGDSISSFANSAGFVTTSKQDLFFDIPLDRPVNATTATVTLSKVTIRNDGTYIVTDENLTSHISHVKIKAGGLEIKLSNSGGWGSSNNIDCVVNFSYTVTFN